MAKGRKKGEMPGRLLAPGSYVMKYVLKYNFIFKAALLIKKVKQQNKHIEIIFHYSYAGM